MIPYLTFLSLNHLGGHWLPGWLLVAADLLAGSYTISGAVLLPGGPPTCWELQPSLREEASVLAFMHHSFSMCFRV